jgi:hypothetical protein
MKINERLYPHPVQSHFSDDLTDCVFQVTPKIHTGKNSYKFGVRARTSSPDLRALVTSGQATYAIHIECAATRFRRLITATDEEFFEEIPGDCLDGRTDLCSLIIATTDIPEYRNRNFHPDYGDISFFVKKGDVLAVGHDIFFDATKGIDPLQNVASIFKVRPNHSTAPEPFVVDLQNNYIVILLSEQNFLAYSELRKDQDRQTTLASMIVTPALVFALEEIKSSAGDSEDEWFMELRWFKVISSKLKLAGYKDLASWSEEPSLLLAQKLIGDPLSSSLKLMLDVEDEGSDE